MYDPISLEVDRQRLFRKLRDAFSDSQIVFQAAEGDEYAQRLFPAHEPEVLDQILSEQEFSNQPVEFTPNVLVAQLESYLAHLTIQSSPVHAEPASFEQGYSRATTQPNKKCCERKGR